MRHLRQGMSYGYPGSAGEIIVICNGYILGIIQISVCSEIICLRKSPGLGLGDYYVQVENAVLNQDRHISAVLVRHHLDALNAEAVVIHVLFGGEGDLVVKLQLLVAVVLHVDDDHGHLGLYA